MKYILYLSLAMFLFASCEKLEIPDISGSEGVNPSELKGENVLTIKTRSVTDDVQFPVAVYVFDKDGKCIESQKVESGDQKLDVSLAKGNYHVIAFGGTEGWNLPSSPTMDSVLELSDETGCSPQALQMGQADVTVGTGNQTINIVLSYMVSTVSLSLENLPSTVSAASVNVSQTCRRMSMRGEVMEVSNAKIDLTKGAAGWQTGRVYVLPGASQKTTFTITLIDSKDASNPETTSYAYTYSAPLLPATPYELKGRYASDMLSMTGTFTSEGWGTTVDLDFTFGPASGENIKGDDDSSGIKVTSFPAPGSLWNGHLVAYLYSKSDADKPLAESALAQAESAEVLLLSLDEWTKIGSAINKTNPNEASEIASNYSEGDVVNWSMPSSAEAKILKSLYSDESISTLNDVISVNGGKPVVPFDSKGENIRYLCDQGNSTFAWKSSSSITKAGATVTYSLRLVSHVHLVKGK